MRSTLAPYDRVRARDRAWRVTRVQSLNGSQSVVEVEALDLEAPRSLSLVVPPEDVEPLPPEGLSLDPRGFDSITAWQGAHRLLGATLVSDDELLRGARFARVQLESYQMAPALRLIAKPRPRLLIADDVGLGKTIEAGLAMLELTARGRLRRTLIVTPPGLLLQWQNELREKFDLDFMIIESATGVARAQSGLPAGVNPWDVLPRVVTSVDFLKKDTIAARALRSRWDLVIVDEAHAVAESGTPSNPYSTQRHRLARRLREASNGLLLLTATPHNGYAHSFRSLLELVEPAGASLHGDPDAIRRRVGHVMIRRMKSQIRRKRADGTSERAFPPRHVRGIPVPLQAAELDLLRQVASYCSRTARAAAGDEDADLVSFAMQIVKKRSLSTRRALTATVTHRLEALRKESAREAPPSPADLRELQAGLALTESASERNALRVLRSAVPGDERRRKAETRALTTIHRAMQKLDGPDAKLEALLAELRQVLDADPAEKIIVFTEYLDSLSAVRERLDADPDLVSRYVVLRGGMSLRARRRAQERFESDEIRVLLATDAAGEGLNLQHHCRQILHLELPWNPNRLEQRNGRVDRYGQSREPEIRYLFYPGSAEEAVLDQLVQKIEAMAESFVSTPDILGVLGGDGALERGLLALDPEADGRDGQGISLVKAFDDRTAEFVRDVKPLLDSSAGMSPDSELTEQLSSASALLQDDHSLESAVLEALGPRAVANREVPEILRIEVPLALRGPGVRPVYPAATFRRGVATRHRAEDVEYLTPLHPLIQAMAGEARRRLVQVYEGDRGVTPRRLAARETRTGEVPAAVFTFLVRIGGEAGCIEERLIAVSLDQSGGVIDGDAMHLAIDAGGTVGRFSVEDIQHRFGARFSSLMQDASAEALRRAHEIVEACRNRREEIARALESDIERDIADRLSEIELEHKLALGLIQADTGQIAMFAAESGGLGERAVEARRAAVLAARDARHAEIASFRNAIEPAAPALLGALFLVPPADADDAGAALATEPRGLS